MRSRPTHAAAGRPRRRRPTGVVVGGCPCCKVSFARLFEDAEPPEATARRTALQAALRHWRHQMAAAIAAEDHDAVVLARNKLHRLVGDCPPFGA